MPQFYCPNLRPGTIELSPEESRHAGASRRLHPGDAIRVFDGHGTTANAIIIGPTNDQVSRRNGAAPIRASVDSTSEESRPRPALTLIVASPKGDRLEWMVEKCTELGVASVCVTQFERSVVSPRNARLDKLRRIALEACKQSDRAWVPAIEAFDSPTRALESCASATRLVADQSGDACSLGRWISQSAAGLDGIAIIIGPEGGFSDGERRAFSATGVTVVSLADSILRTETAALAAAACFAASQSR